MLAPLTRTDPTIVAAPDRCVPRFDSSETIAEPADEVPAIAENGDGTPVAGSGTDAEIIAEACKVAGRLPRYQQAGYRSKSHFYRKLKWGKLMADLETAATALAGAIADRDQLRLALAAAEAEAAKQADLAAQERARLLAELDNLRASAIPITDRLSMVLRLSGFPTIDALKHWLDMPQPNFDNHLRQIFEAQAQRAEAALNQGVQHA